ncbi:MAG: phosphoribosylglycinamide formyltransferase [Bradymonadia bacterium]
MTPRRRLAVLISGNGSNLQAIIDAIETGTLDAEIAVVVSNRRGAYGLKRAEAAGLPTEYMPMKPYTQDGRGRSTYDADLARLVSSHQPDLVVLAGWMHILSVAFLDRFPQRVINLHPALPGAFPGTHAIERAWAAAQRKQIDHTGVMVHYVVPEVDAGPTLCTETVPVFRGITLKGLEGQIRTVEHRLLVEAVAKALATTHHVQENLFEESTS